MLAGLPEHLVPILCSAPLHRRVADAEVAVIRLALRVVLAAVVEGTLVLADQATRHLLLRHKAAMAVPQQDRVPPCFPTTAEVVAGLRLLALTQQTLLLQRPEPEAMVAAEQPLQFPVLL